MGFFHSFIILTAGITSNDKIYDNSSKSCPIKMVWSVPESVHKTACICYVWPCLSTGHMIDHVMNFSTYGLHKHLVCHFAHMSHNCDCDCDCDFPFRQVVTSHTTLPHHQFYDALSDSTTCPILLLLVAMAFMDSWPSIELHSGHKTFALCCDK